MLAIHQIRETIHRVMQPGQFFAGGSIGLEWAHSPREDISWEIFRGRLLDPAHSRVRQTFESWNLWQLDAAGRSGEPLLAVKLADRHIHVVRAILTHAWEAFDAGANVIDTRPRQKWQRELVGSIDLASFADPADLETELAVLLHQAVVGTSRLALTSLEAPLPAFSLGQLMYVYRPDVPADQGPLRTLDELIAQLTSTSSKLLEFILRVGSASQKPVAVSHLDEAALTALLLDVFNDVALSPYTGFVDQALAFARAHLSPGYQLTFLGTLLRRLCRHLTAFDLVIFHHRGANYPDALLLDAALKQYRQLSEEHPELFQDRLARRALRQGWLLRRHYEGHRVPDLPTSEGENLRVLPTPFARIPDEQINDPKRRPRQLFADDPLELADGSRRVLEQSLADLDDAAELRELGTALFLDRPLGIIKQPGEPDRTPLLSYIAFSRSIAKKRLAEFVQLGVLDAARGSQRVQQLDRLAVKGLALEPPSRSGRPGAASLADALQVANDFVLLRTTRRSIAEFLHWLDPAIRKSAGDPQLIVGGSMRKGRRPETLTFFDTDLHPYLEVTFDPTAGMTCRRGCEFPASGLSLVGDAS